MQSRPLSWQLAHVVEPAMKVETEGDARRETRWPCKLSLAESASNSNCESRARGPTLRVCSFAQSLLTTVVSRRIAVCLVLSAQGSTSYPYLPPIRADPEKGPLPFETRNYCALDIWRPLRGPVTIQEDASMDAAILKGACHSFRGLGR